MLVSNAVYMCGTGWVLVVRITMILSCSRLGVDTFIPLGSTRPPTFMFGFYTGGVIRIFRGGFITLFMISSTSNHIMIFQCGYNYCNYTK